MGLDNYPNRYPCLTKQTAVLADRGDGVEVIDCDATQAEGGCPWQNAEDRPETGMVVGIFGTSCWYRGKVGNALIEEFGSYDESTGHSFYGSNADADHKTPDECRMLAEYLRTLDPADDAEAREMLAYAAWWLDWVAEHGDGAGAWY